MKNINPELAASVKATEILHAGIEAAQGPVSLACSFSMEDVAIIDLAHQAGLHLGVFALDTGRLNEETYEVAEALVERYRLKIDWFFPRHEEVEQLERTEGLFSFRESLDKRHACCHIRKVEPLVRALQGLSGWVTGMRREQSPTRNNLQAIEQDELNGGILAPKYGISAITKNFSAGETQNTSSILLTPKNGISAITKNCSAGETQNTSSILLKINPLIDWTEEDLLAYTDEHKLPRNRLYSRGYRSIGCAPCTREVREGEDARAGRWWWENAENKECGLHRR
jgi:phosphoadenosine phosphosulfate reductase